MCGIAGYLGPHFDGLPEMGEVFSRSLAHRGPDDKGRILLEVGGPTDRSLLLEHRRLSIIDLSQLGHQPMHDPASGDWIVYNGEIYNFHDLRQTLTRGGVGFVSQSDTEVILKGYAARGRVILDDLCGMFALAIWDARRRELFLAVDPVRIKPLYYWQGPRGEFLFASELRALLDTGLVPRRLDPIGLEGYLSYGAVQGPNTIIADVRVMPPGTYLVVSAEGTISGPHPYWEPPFLPEREKPRSADEVVGDLGDLLGDSVRKHLVSDVPVGVFLSGGIDSSAVAALANEQSREIRTYSVTFAEEEFSEALYSREVAKQHRLNHTELCLSENDFLSKLPRALDAVDQPTIDGLNVFVISEAIREAGVKVALSGQGGDEVFGGYATFRQVPFAYEWRRRLRMVPPLGWRLGGKLWNAVQARRRAMPDKIGQFLNEDGSPCSTYFLLRQLFPPAVRRVLFPGERGGADREGMPSAEGMFLREACASLDPVNAVSLLELRTFLGNMLLRDGDTMSMAHGLEVRVPFLERRVVDFLAKLPGSMKMDRILPKPLLLRAMGDRIPPMIYRRPKQGFTFPWPHWLRRQLRPMAEEALRDEETYRELGLDPRAVDGLWRAFLGNRRGISWSRVWALIALREWAVRCGIRS